MKIVKNIAQYIQGQISLEQTVAWIKPWRLNYKEADLHFPAVTNNAQTGAGVRIVFNTNSENVTLKIVPYIGNCNFDLTIDGKLIQTVEVIEGLDVIEFASLPAGDKTVEIWLNQSREVKIKDILIDDSANVAKPDDKRIKWLTYGSSITHCNGAHSPARTWPATAARMLNLSLTSMGFGGNCHCEPLVAMTIRDHEDVDLITLKLGINIQGGSTLNARTYGPAVIGLVRSIRDKHPKTTIGVISSIISPPRETTENEAHLSLSDMRAITEDSVKRLINAGDKNLYYFDGLELISREDAPKYIPDELHPDGDGYEFLGKAIAEKVLTPLLNK